MLLPDACERCGHPLRFSIVSRFNTEAICGGCERREKAHPSYAEAAAAELAAIQAGDLNYPGIGCPPELYLTEVRA